MQSISEQITFNLGKVVRSNNTIFVRRANLIQSLDTWSCDARTNYFLWATNSQNQTQRMSFICWWAWTCECEILLLWATELKYHSIKCRWYEGINQYSVSFNNCAESKEENEQLLGLLTNRKLLNIRPFCSSDCEVGSIGTISSFLYVSSCETCELQTLRPTKQNDKNIYFFPFSCRPFYRCIALASKAHIHRRIMIFFACRFSFHPVQLKVGVAVAHPGIANDYNDESAKKYYTYYQWVSGLFRCLFLVCLCAWRVCVRASRTNSLKAISHCEWIKNDFNICFYRTFALVSFASFRCASVSSSRYVQSQKFKSLTNELPRVGKWI